METALANRAPTRPTKTQEARKRVPRVISEPAHLKAKVSVRRDIAIIQEELQVYRRQVEQLQQALDHPEIRNEAVQILRGLIEHVSIRPAENGRRSRSSARSRKWSNLALGLTQNRPISIRDWPVR